MVTAKTSWPITFVRKWYHISFYNSRLKKGNKWQQITIQLETKKYLIIDKVQGTLVKDLRVSENAPFHNTITCVRVWARYHVIKLNISKKTFLVFFFILTMVVYVCASYKMCWFSKKAKICSLVPKREIVSERDMFFSLDCVWVKVNALLWKMLWLRLDTFTLKLTTCLDKWHMAQEML